MEDECLEDPGPHSEYTGPSADSEAYCLSCPECFHRECYEWPQEMISYRDANCPGCGVKIFLEFEWSVSVIPRFNNKPAEVIRYG